MTTQTPGKKQTKKRVVLSRSKKKKQMIVAAQTTPTPQTKNEENGQFEPKYKPEYGTVEFMEAFCDWCDEQSVPYIVKVQGSKPTKKTPQQTVMVPRQVIPSKERLARYLKVYPDTIENWEKKYPEFKRATRYLMSRQKDRFIELGAAGIGHAAVHRLVLMSNHGMKEKKENDNNHSFGLLKRLYDESENLPAGVDEDKVRDVDVFEDDNGNE